MSSTAYLALLDGKYICHIAYPREYEFLNSENNTDVVDQWLGRIDMRLARLGGEGAYFMAPIQLDSADTARIKQDFLRYRDVYGPAQRMLQFIRAGKEEFTLGVGEVVQLAELNQAVNESATLESQLRALHSVINDGSARFNNRELIKKLLEHLRNDGYLVLINPNAEVYQTTGKMVQLKAVLTFLAENTDIVGSNNEIEEAQSEGDLFESEKRSGE
jgi:hypothetical protein